MGWKHVYTGFLLVVALCFCGCTGLWNQTKASPEAKKIVEEDIKEPLSSPAPVSEQRESPAEVNDPPAPPVTEPTRVVDPGERLPRRIKRDRGGRWE